MDQLSGCLYWVPQVMVRLQVLPLDDVCGCQRFVDETTRRSRGPIRNPNCERRYSVSCRPLTLSTSWKRSPTASHHPLQTGPRIHELSVWNNLDLNARLAWTSGSDIWGAARARNLYAPSRITPVEPRVLEEH